MENERYIVCGGADADIPADHQREVLRFHLYGPDDDYKIKLQIDDIRKQMYQEVPDRFRDLLDIATYVFAADQAVHRGTGEVETFGSNWHRRLHFVIPVTDLDFWRSENVKKCLCDTVGFLSDDTYSFDFVPLPSREMLQGMLNFSNTNEAVGNPEQVVMFSGGLDSLAGAVEECVVQKRRVVLVNHRPTQKLDQRYAALRKLLADKTPANSPYHVRVTVHKQKWMNKEYTQRTRSFLFVSLGATIARMLGLSGVRFYENGVISMNLPICAQVVGGKATRTTHPRVLRGYQQLLSLVADEAFTVENPFVWKTKAEIVESIMKAGCAEMIGPSISCTHTWEMTKQHSHCGTCSQCVDRRFAVIAANAEVHDPIEQYAVDVFTQTRAGVEEINEDKTLFAYYVERANQVALITSATRFLSTFPEVARLLRHLDGTPGTAAMRCHELYMRHSAEVNRVVESMMARHGTAIRQRTLAADSLLRVVYESYLPTSLSVLPGSPEQLPDNMFCEDGYAWKVRFKGGKALTLPPMLGVSYIHHLLSFPGEALSVIEISGNAAADACDRVINAKEAIDAGLTSVTHPLMTNLGAISDMDAVKQYRSRVRELLLAVEEARTAGDSTLVAQYEREIAELATLITNSIGLGGRLKKAKDFRKTRRDAFSGNVKRAIEKLIRPYDAPMADHLTGAIQFGNMARYQPEDGLEWETRPRKID